MGRVIGAILVFLVLLAVVLFVVFGGLSAVVNAVRADIAYCGLFNVNCIGNADGQADPAAEPVTVPRVAELPDTEHPNSTYQDTGFLPVLCNDDPVGADFLIQNWDDPNNSMQIVVPEGYSFVTVSSDPGVISGYSSADWGFTAGVSVEPGQALTISGVGFNQANGHYNTSACAFPADMDLRGLLLDLQEREKKPLSFIISDGQVEYVQVPSAGFQLSPTN